ncbi:DUF3848 domain-containing protein [Turicibacter sanguinis]|nr:DUF3848 domain-containing protein [Turicibacter sanguinis]MTP47953.1 DUF3848 domain-containing protein [Turicibacter sanguinis]MTP50701.1 DUF3848 domain-containing protein [Turicibacter sanguinis]MTQ07937.1 DUF3848 domain-containing protein [Turicibacter sanguinis]
MKINKQVILYERIQAEYDQFIEELLNLDKTVLAERLHELVLKTMILNLIVEELYSETEKEFLTTQEMPLSCLYEIFKKYI